MEQFSDSGRVTYTPRSGNAIAVAAIVGDEVATEEDHSTGRRRVLRRTLAITTDPGGTYAGITAPALSGTVAVDGVSYAVESIKPLGRDVFDVVVVRREAMEVSRRDYRRGPNDL